MYQVYIKDKKLDRRALSYMFAELTGIEKFRINHTTTSGEFRGNKILGKHMRHNSDMMNGIEFSNTKGATERLLGIRDFLNLYYDDYSIKYLDTVQSEEEELEIVPKKITGILDSEPVVVPKESGVFKENPVYVDNKAESIMQTIVNTFTSPSTATEDAFEEEQRGRCPNGEHINHETEKCEPVVRKIKSKLKTQSEPVLPLVSIAKPVDDAGFIETASLESVAPEPFYLQLKKNQNLF